MFLHDWIGLLAGTLTTAAFIPQVIKIWRSKKADDISVSMFLIFTVGVALWMIYGIQIASLPVMLANAVTMILALIILILKYCYRK
ncbi:MAG: SemiSWEET family sugar transporter [Sulfuriferula sp.]